MNAPKEKIVRVRGFLLHITHYDPDWIKRKQREKPFDLDLGLEIIDTMSEVGLNLLVIDCADGVKYKSHPELARKYTVPMACLQKLVQRAEERKIEIVPKLNFSQGTEGHNLWFRPHHDLFDSKDYWRIAFELMDELIKVCQPRHYFHIGMDEDFGRSHAQYIRAILTLRSGLKKRGVRPVIWNDSALAGTRYDVFAEKCMAAEKTIPKDVVQVPWCYGRPLPEIIRRLAGEGFEVWGAPGRSPDQVLKWKEAILRYGGKGLLLTRWIPCRRSNRSDLLNLLRTAGPICNPGN